MAHLTSQEAFAKLDKAKKDLAKAKKAKKTPEEIKKLQKAVNDAQAVANLF